VVWITVYFRPLHPLIPVISFCWLRILLGVGWLTLCHCLMFFRFGTIVFSVECSPFFGILSRSFLSPSADFFCGLTTFFFPFPPSLFCYSAHKTVATRVEQASIAICPFASPNRTITFNNYPRFTHMAKLPQLLRRGCKASPGAMRSRCGSSSEESLDRRPGLVIFSTPFFPWIFCGYQHFLRLLRSRHLCFFRSVFSKLHTGLFPPPKNSLAFRNRPIDSFFFA